MMENHQKLTESSIRLYIKGSFVSVAEFVSSTKLNHALKSIASINLKWRLDMTDAETRYFRNVTSLPQGRETYGQGWYYNVYELSASGCHFGLQKLRTCVKNQVAVVKVGKDQLLLMADNQITQRLGIKPFQSSEGCRLHCIHISRHSSQNRDESAVLQTKDTQSPSLCAGTKSDPFVANFSSWPPDSSLLTKETLSELFVKQFENCQQTDTRSSCARTDHQFVEKKLIKGEKHEKGKSSGKAGKSERSETEAEDGTLPERKRHKSQVAGDIDSPGKSKEPAKVKEKVKATQKTGIDSILSDLKAVLKTRKTEKLRTDQKKSKHSDKHRSSSKSSKSDKPSAGRNKQQSVDEVFSSMFSGLTKEIGRIPKKSRTSTEKQASSTKGQAEIIENTEKETKKSDACKPEAKKSKHEKKAENSKSKSDKKDKQSSHKSKHKHDKEKSKKSKHHKEKSNSKSNSPDLGSHSVSERHDDTDVLDSIGKGWGIQEMVRDALSGECESKGKSGRAGARTGGKEAAIPGLGDLDKLMAFQNREKVKVVRVKRSVRVTDDDLKISLSGSINKKRHSGIKLDLQDLINMALFGDEVAIPMATECLQLYECILSLHDFSPSTWTKSVTKEMVQEKKKHLYIVKLFNLDHVHGTGKTPDVTSAIDRDKKGAKNERSCFDDVVQKENSGDRTFPGHVHCKGADQVLIIPDRTAAVVSSDDELSDINRNMDVGKNKIPSLSLEVSSFSKQSEENFAETGNDVAENLDVRRVVQVDKSKGKMEAPAGRPSTPSDRKRRSASSEGKDNERSQERDYQDSRRISRSKESSIDREGQNQSKHRSRRSQSRERRRRSRSGEKRRSKSRESRRSQSRSRRSASRDRNRPKTPTSGDKDSGKECIGKRLEKMATSTASSGPDKTTVRTEKRHERQYHPYRKDDRPSRRHIPHWSFDLAYSDMNELLLNMTENSFKRKNKKPADVSRTNSFGRRSYGYRNRGRFYQYRFRRSEIQRTPPREVCNSSDDEDYMVHPDEIPDLKARAKQADVLENFMGTGDDEKEYSTEMLIYEKEPKEDQRIVCGKGKQLRSAVVIPGGPKTSTFSGQELDDSSEASEELAFLGSGRNFENSDKQTNQSSVIERKDTYTNSLVKLRFEEVKTRGRKQELNAVDKKDELSRINKDDSKGKSVKLDKIEKEKVYVSVDLPLDLGNDEDNVNKEGKQFIENGQRGILSSDSDVCLDWTDEDVALDKKESEVFKDSSNGISDNDSVLTVVDECVQTPDQSSDDVSELEVTLAEHYMTIDSVSDNDGTPKKSVEKVYGIKECCVVLNSAECKTSTNTAGDHNSENKQENVSSLIEENKPCSDMKIDNNSVKDSGGHEMKKHNVNTENLVHKLQTSKGTDNEEITYIESKKECVLKDSTQNQNLMEESQLALTRKELSVKNDDQATDKEDSEMHVVKETENIERQVKNLQQFAEIDDEISIDVQTVKQIESEVLEEFICNQHLPEDKHNEQVDENVTRTVIEKDTKPILLKRYVQNVKLLENQNKETEKDKDNTARSFVDQAIDSCILVNKKNDCSLNFSPTKIIDEAGDRLVPDLVNLNSSECMHKMFAEASGTDKDALEAEPSCSSQISLEEKSTQSSPAVSTEDIVIDAKAARTDKDVLEAEPSCSSPQISLEEKSTQSSPAVSTEDIVIDAKTAGTDKGALEAELSCSSPQISLEEKSTQSSPAVSTDDIVIDAKKGTDKGALEAEPICSSSQVSLEETSIQSSPAVYTEDNVTDAEIDPAYFGKNRCIYVDEIVITGKMELDITKIEKEMDACNYQKKDKFVKQYEAYRICSEDGSLSHSEGIPDLEALDTASQEIDSSVFDTVHSRKEMFLSSEFVSEHEQTLKGKEKNTIKDRNIFIIMNSNLYNNSTETTTNQGIHHAQSHVSNMNVDESKENVTSPGKERKSLEKQRQIFDADFSSRVNTEGTKTELDKLSEEISEKLEEITHDDSLVSDNNDVMIKNESPLLDKCDAAEDAKTGSQVARAKEIVVRSGSESLTSLKGKGTSPAKITDHSYLLEQSFSDTEIQKLMKRSIPEDSCRDNGSFLKSECVAYSIENSSQMPQNCNLSKVAGGLDDDDESTSSTWAYPVSETDNECYQRSDAFISKLEDEAVFHIEDTIDEGTDERTVHGQAIAHVESYGNSQRRSDSKTTDTKQLEQDHKQAEQIEQNFQQSIENDKSNTYQPLAFSPALHNPYTDIPGQYFQRPSLPVSQQPYSMWPTVSPWQRFPISHVSPLSPIHVPLQGSPLSMVPQGMNQQSFSTFSRNQVPVYSSSPNYSAGTSLYSPSLMNYLVNGGRLTPEQPAAAPQNAVQSITSMAPWIISTDNMTPYIQDRNTDTFFVTEHTVDKTVKRSVTPGSDRKTECGESFPVYDIPVHEIPLPESSPLRTVSNPRTLKDICSKVLECNFGLDLNSPNLQKNDDTICIRTKTIENTKQIETDCAISEGNACEKMNIFEISTALDPKSDRKTESKESLPVLDIPIHEIPLPESGLPTSPRRVKGRRTLKDISKKVSKYNCQPDLSLLKLQKNNDSLCKPTGNVMENKEQIESDEGNTAEETGIFESPTLLDCPAHDPLMSVSTLFPCEVNNPKQLKILCSLKLEQLHHSNFNPVKLQNASSTSYERNVSSVQDGESIEPGHTNVYCSRSELDCENEKIDLEENEINPLETLTCHLESIQPKEAIVPVTEIRNEEQQCIKKDILTPTILTDENEVRSQTEEGIGKMTENPETFLNVNAPINVVQVSKSVSPQRLYKPKLLKELCSKLYLCGSNFNFDSCGKKDNEVEVNNQIESKKPNSGHCSNRNVSDFDSDSVQDTVDVAGKSENKMQIEAVMNTRNISRVINCQQSQIDKHKITKYEVMNFTDKSESPAESCTLYNDLNLLGVDSVADKAAVTRTDSACVQSTNDAFNAELEAGSQINVECHFVSNQKNYVLEVCKTACNYVKGNEDVDTENDLSVELANSIKSAGKVLNTKNSFSDEPLTDKKNSNSENVVSEVISTNKLLETKNTYEKLTTPNVLYGVGHILSILKKTEENHEQIFSKSSAQSDILSIEEEQISKDGKVGKVVENLGKNKDYEKSVKEESSSELETKVLEAQSKSFYINVDKTCDKRVEFACLQSGLDSGNGSSEMFGVNSENSEDCQFKEQKFCKNTDECCSEVSGSVIECVQNTDDEVNAELEARNQINAGWNIANSQRSSISEVSKSECNDVKESKDVGIENDLSVKLANPTKAADEVFYSKNSLSDEPLTFKKNSNSEDAMIEVISTNEFLDTEITSVKVRTPNVLNGVGHILSILKQTEKSQEPIFRKKSPAESDLHTVEEDQISRDNGEVENSGKHKEHEQGVNEDNSSEIETEVLEAQLKAFYNDINVNEICDTTVESACLQSGIGTAAKNSEVLVVNSEKSEEYQVKDEKCCKSSEVCYSEFSEDVIYCVQDTTYVEAGNEINAGLHLQNQRSSISEMAKSECNDVKENKDLDKEKDLSEDLANVHKVFNTKKPLSDEPLTFKNFNSEDVIDEAISTKECLKTKNTSGNIKKTNVLNGVGHILSILKKVEGNNKQILRKETEELSIDEVQISRDMSVVEYLGKHRKYEKGVNEDSSSELETKIPETQVKSFHSDVDTDKVFDTKARFACRQDELDTTKESCEVLGVKGQDSEYCQFEDKKCCKSMGCSKVSEHVFGYKDKNDESSRLKSVTGKSKVFSDSGKSLLSDIKDKQYTKLDRKHCFTSLSTASDSSIDMLATKDDIHVNQAGKAECERSNLSDQISSTRNNEQIEETSEIEIPRKQAEIRSNQNEKTELLNNHDKSWLTDSLHKIDDLELYLKARRIVKGSEYCKLGNDTMNENMLKTSNPAVDLERKGIMKAAESSCSENGHLTEYIKKPDDTALFLKARGIVREREISASENAEVNEVLNETHDQDATLNARGIKRASEAQETKPIEIDIVLTEKVPKCQIFKSDFRKGSVDNYTKIKHASQIPGISKDVYYNMKPSAKLVTQSLFGIKGAGRSVAAEKGAGLGNKLHKERNKLRLKAMVQANQFHHLKHLAADKEKESRTAYTKAWIDQTRKQMKMNQTQTQSNENEVKCSISKVTEANTNKCYRMHRPESKASSQSTYSESSKSSCPESSRSRSSSRSSSSMSNTYRFRTRTYRKHQASSDSASSSAIPKHNNGKRNEEKKSGTGRMYDPRRLPKSYRSPSMSSCSRSVSSSERHISEDNAGCVQLKNRLASRSKRNRSNSSSSDSTSRCSRRYKSPIVSDERQEMGRSRSHKGRLFSSSFENGHRRRRHVSNSSSSRSRSSERYGHRQPRAYRKKTHSSSSSRERYRSMQSRGRKRSQSSSSLSSNGRHRSESSQSGIKESPNRKRSPSFSWRGRYRTRMSRPRERYRTRAKGFLTDTSDDVNYYRKSRLSEFHRQSKWGRFRNIFPSASSYRSSSEISTESQTSSHRSCSRTRIPTSDNRTCNRTICSSSPKYENLTEAVKGISVQYADVKSPQTKENIHVPSHGPVQSLRLKKVLLKPVVLKKLQTAGLEKFLQALDGFSSERCTWILALLASDVLELEDQVQEAIKMLENQNENLSVITDVTSLDSYLLRELRNPDVLEIFVIIEPPDEDENIRSIIRYCCMKTFLDCHLRSSIVTELLQE